MSNYSSELLAALQVKFPTAHYQLDAYHEHNLILDAAQLYDCIDWLKKDGFIYLTDLTGSHYPENEGAEYQVVYHLHNLVKNVRLRIKVNLSASNVEIPSITNIYAGANWMERETFDFFGINFLGHPNLKRILNMDEMDYHPMRKEYALEDETRTDKDDTFFGR